MNAGQGTSQPSKSPQRIEILGVHLLESLSGLVGQFRRLADRFQIALGWHYLLDLAWTANELGQVGAARILDAGAGTGAMQWWLAEGGAEVVSVDRQPRHDLSMRFRMAYNVAGYRPQDLLPPHELLGARLRDERLNGVERLRAAGRVILGGALAALRPKAPGRVLLHQADLGRLEGVPDAAFDAIVSISALEHNSPEQLPGVLAELLRVLRPGGRLIVTLAAARGETWLHEPSSGWCYSEQALREAFGLEADCPSNFDRYDELMFALRECDQLREQLSPYYFQSGENGMPWGIWDPKYQPVGVIRCKPG